MLTNAHAVRTMLAGREAARIFLSRKGRPRRMRAKRLVAVSVTYDLALFELEGATPHYLTIADGSADNNLQLVGYPAGSFLVTRQLARLVYQGPYYHVVPFDRYLVAGMSGGPIFDAGNVVVALFSFSEANLGYGIQARYLKRFISRNREAFEAGVTCGQRELPGRCHRRGIYQAKKLAYQKGHVLAQYYLFEATGERRYLLSSAAGGLNLARISLGTYYRRDGKSSDGERRAYALFQKAADSHDPRAQYSLAHLPQIQKDLDLVFDLITQSAKGGYGPAYYIKGYLQYDWIGTERAKRNGIAWWKKAVRIGKDEQTLSWFQKTAREGDTSAQALLKSISMQYR